MPESKVKIRLISKSPIHGASWCTPVGWAPDNVVDGIEFRHGGWWFNGEKVFSLVWYGYGRFGETVDVDPEDLGIAIVRDNVIVEALCRQR